MIKHFWSILCKSSSIDKSTNNISLFDVIEEVKIAGPPLPVDLKEKEDLLLPLNFELVTLWAREDEANPISGEAKIITKTPYGKEFVSKIIPVDLSKFLRTRTRIKYNGIPFQKSGLYKFLIMIKKGNQNKFEEIANIELQLTFKIEKNISKVKANQ